MLPDQLTAFIVRNSDQECRGAIETISLDQLAPGEVTIAVKFSSLNYKDAMAAQGHSGIVRRLPHVPGIDAAGTVIESGSDNFSPNDEVIVTGYGLGSDQWGGWSELIRVPAAWVVPKPERLSLREAMILGTAGFTAAQCVCSLLHHEVVPENGPVVVTGASGGVGSVSVAILSKLGFEVTAVSGKSEQTDWLKQLGAHDIVGRDAILHESNRPMLKGQWAGAVDTVGGQTLASLVRSTTYRGAIACCGLVGGTDLPLTVYPFLLRGVTLDGIDSAQCPYDRRLKIWEKLSGDWKPSQLEAIANEVALSDVGEAVRSILAGGVVGRTVVRIQD